MDFETVAFGFFLTYQTLLIPLLALGLANLIVGTYSLAFVLYSVMMFALFIAMGIQVFAYIAVAAVVIGFVLKYIGL